MYFFKATSNTSDFLFKFKYTILPVEGGLFLQARRPGKVINVSTSCRPFTNKEIFTKFH
jgi:hypothetical protein